MPADMAELVLALVQPAGRKGTDVWEEEDTYEEGRRLRECEEDTYEEGRRLQLEDVEINKYMYPKALSCCVHPRSACSWRGAMFHHISNMSCYPKVENQDSTHILQVHFLPYFERMLNCQLRKTQAEFLQTGNKYPNSLTYVTSKDFTLRRIVLYFVCGFLLEIFRNLLLL
ncbi:hypothetical protein HYPBUDRAFT_150750 [Hyphopichia burtonii NRRL Y-1933]|uniref:Uncharacterized protein n=1 Tax=Hyphopichia burtonii NRRL Y-1933 TaxID=984485 RepID=A0A1E4RC32_9ASCO|nr:hypothetical protein HYPBUDRAFT_150750 [Hyphopichia burtonii NRRL Y-1933]ODV64814.1 hypothetical protein HYPBUDRAFT_150750 [Hyphopichia burtonii NRRL Y-1933]